MIAKPNSRRKIFFLDNDAIKIIEDISKEQGISQSALIEYWVFSFDENMNPNKKLMSIKKEQKILKDKLIELEKEEESYINQINTADEWRKKRQKERPNIVSNIIRVLSESRYEDAEQIAKIQGIKLGIKPLELIKEATDKMRNGI